MNELIKIDIVNGKPSVTSLQVALAFGKEHRTELAQNPGMLDKYRRRKAA